MAHSLRGVGFFCPLARSRGVVSLICSAGGQGQREEWHSLGIADQEIASQQGIEAQSCHTGIRSKLLITKEEKQSCHTLPHTFRPYPLEIIGKSAILPP